MWASENQSDVEAELELKDPIEMGGDASTFEDDKDRGVVSTSVDHHAPMATPIGGGRDTKRCGNILVSRKHAMGLDSAVE